MMIANPMRVLTFDRQATPRSEGDVPLKPFEQLDTEALRILGFTISVTRDGELAAVKGEMKAEIYRSGDELDQFVLVVTLPCGEGFVATLPRDELRDAIE
jgi:hypothetical protein